MKIENVSFKLVINLNSSRILICVTSVWYDVDSVNKY